MFSKKCAKFLAVILACVMVLGNIAAGNVVVAETAETDVIEVAYEYMPVYVGADELQINEFTYDSSIDEYCTISSRMQNVTRIMFTYPTLVEAKGESATVGTTEAASVMIDSNVKLPEILANPKVEIVEGKAVLTVSFDETLVESFLGNAYKMTIPEGYLNIWNGKEYVKSSEINLMTRGSKLCTRDVTRTGNGVTAGFTNSDIPSTVPECVDAINKAVHDMEVVEPYVVRGAVLSPADVVDYQIPDNALYTNMTVPRKVLADLLTKSSEVRAAYKAMCEKYREVYGGSSWESLPDNITMTIPDSYSVDGLFRLSGANVSENVPENVPEQYEGKDVISSSAFVIERVLINGDEVVRHTCSGLSFPVVFSLDIPEELSGKGLYILRYEEKYNSGVRTHTLVDVIIPDYEDDKAVFATHDAGTFVVIATDAAPESNDGAVVLGDVEKSEDGRYKVISTGLTAEETYAHFLKYAIYDAADNIRGIIEARVWKEDILKKDSSEYYTGYASVWDMATGNNSTLTMTTDLENISFDNKSWTKVFEASDYTYKLISDKPLHPMLDVTNVVWDNGTKPGVVSFMLPELTDGYVTRFIGNGVDISSTVRTGRTDKIDYSKYITESGTYTFTIRALGGKVVGNSDSVTATYEYVKPEETLGVSDKLWWTAKEGEKIPGIINWNPVAGAAGYEIQAGKSAKIYVYNTDDKMITSYDFTSSIIKWLNSYGEDYKVVATVRALSGDIGVIANASEAAVSGDFVLAEDVEAEVNSTVSESTVDTIVSDIENIGVDEMADAMQNNSDVLDKVKDLEEEYKEAKDIEELPPVIEHSKVDAEGMDIVGAALNAVTRSAISINMGVPEDTETVNEELYKNVVQVNITLNIDNEAVKGILSVPVTITMKLPVGVDAKNLVILHFLGDGSKESIYPVVNGDMITFSTTSFSTFAFANYVYFNEEGSELKDYTDDKEDDTPVVPDTPIIPNTPVVPDYSDNDYEYDPKDTIEYRFAGKEGWQKVNSAWYYFNANGKLKTGWVEDTDGKFYYMDAETGKMQTGWVRSAKSGLWYYMDTTNGDMKSNGWLCDPESGRWYYLDVNGAMCTSWIVVDGMWYLLDTNGAMCTGWNKVNDEWYLLGSNGAMLTGWQMVGDKEYYLDENGKCLMNTTTPDGFAVDENGAKIK